MNDIDHPLPSWGLLFAVQWELPLDMNSSVPVDQFWEVLVSRICLTKRYLISGILLCMGRSRFVMSLLGIMESLFHLGVSAAMIPIPWKLPLPSVVRMLWSTLSPTKRSVMSCTSMSSASVSGATEFVEFFWKRNTYVYEETNPITWRVSTRKHDQYIWCACTARSICNGATTARGRAACIIACKIAATFRLVYSPTKNHIKVYGVSQGQTREQFPARVTLCLDTYL